MKKYILSGIWCVFLCALASCSKTLDLQEQEGADMSMAMTFGSSHITKASSNDNISNSFKVWGLLMDGNAIFDAEQIINQNGSWIYTSATRYWKQNSSYAFYAVYPENSMEASSAGMDSWNSSTVIDVKNNPQDCLFAVRNVKTNVGNPGAVSMNFNHILCQVDIKGKVEALSGESVEIISAKISGVSYEASFSYSNSGSTYSASNVNWTAEKPEKLFKSVQGLVLGNQPASLFGDSFFAIPQSLNDNCKLTVKYRLGNKEKSVESSLGGYKIGVLNWMPNQKYIYNFTITIDGYLVFDAPSVEEWKEGSAGSFIVA